jgi:hypothetical protein
VTPPQVAARLARALELLVAAGSATDVAKSAVAGAAELTGARAAALGVRRGRDVRILASTGYGCDSMAAGATLSMDAGLPLTEAVRQGRPVLKLGADGAGWIAVPLSAPGGRGALLVSLVPSSTGDVEALKVLARATAAAWRRCPDAEDPPRSEWTLDPPRWLRVAAVHQAADPTAGSGDLVTLLPGARTDSAWLVVADACGSGDVAASVAGAFERVGRTLVAAEVTTDGLLAAADWALRRELTEDQFLTATAVHLRHEASGLRAAVSAAGHPAGMLWRDGRVTPVSSRPASPLNLLPPDLHVPAAPGVSVQMRPGDLLLVHTDGLVDRGADDLTELLMDVFARAGELSDPATVLDILLTALHSAGGRMRDDIAAVVIGVP